MSSLDKKDHQEELVRRGSPLNRWRATDTRKASAYAGPMMLGPARGVFNSKERCYSNQAFGALERCRVLVR